MLLKAKTRQKCLYSRSFYSEPSNEDPEKDKEETVIEKSIKNNNLITIDHQYGLKKLHPLCVRELKSKPISTINFADKNTILSNYRDLSAIYLIHNEINGKQYIGSAFDLSKRIANYYFPSRLIDNRYISNSILKYGHNNFVLVILEILGKSEFQSKSSIINREQYYIDLYKPVLNINPVAGSSLGFKHSEKSKKLIAEFRKNKPLPESTKLKLSKLFSGELNPFWSKKHSVDSIEKMRAAKLGILNPMYNKIKSREFIEQMYKDKSGPHNPMFGKPKSAETLAKMSIKVYLYNAETKKLIRLYDSINIAVKDLKIASETIRKYLDTDKVYKNFLFYSELK
jgi:group I intron endonuclease